jgi:hypothetical protein
LQYLVTIKSFVTYETTWTYWEKEKKYDPRQLGLHIFYFIIAISVRRLLCDNLAVLRGSTNISSMSMSKHNPFLENNGCLAILLFAFIIVVIALIAHSIIHT